VSKDTVKPVPWQRRQTVADEQEGGHGSFTATEMTCLKNIPVVHFAAWFRDCGYNLDTDQM
jgi:hypothetical protein